MELIAIEYTLSLINVDGNGLKLLVRQLISLTELNSLMEPQTNLILFDIICAYFP